MSSVGLPSVLPGYQSLSRIAAVATVELTAVTPGAGHGGQHCRNGRGGQVQGTSTSCRSSRLRHEDCLDARDQRGAVSPQDTRILATHAPQVHPVRARGPLTGMAAVLAQGIRGSLPTILSTGLRGPTMLIAQ